MTEQLPKFMTKNYEFLQGNAITATEEASFPLIKGRMFDISDFYAEAENAKSGNDGINELITCNLETKVLYPLQNWRNGIC